jgi:uncharacterized protein (TIGR03118 family)
MKAISRRFHLSARLSVQPLEDRSTPTAVAFTQTNLVADQSGVAQVTDASLINPWGVAFGPSTEFWIADNGKNVSTQYAGDANGTPLAVFSPLPVVTGLTSPTGQVFNGSPDFAIHDSAGHSGPAIFIVANQDGSIDGWNPSVPPSLSTVFQVAVPASRAIYKGLAIANNTIGTQTGNFLYAADFAGGKIDVFNSQFQHVTISGSFADTNLPAGFAPFNIQALGGKLYVTYAKQDIYQQNDVTGPGNGVVDVFDTAGNLLKRLTSGGVLNSPWGLALAPASFGAFAGDLLVGNFGDGHINAFDPNSGALVGTAQNASGAPLAIPGLWALVVGNGGQSGDSNKVYFTSGPGNLQHGLVGSLAPTTVVTDTGRIAVGANSGGVGTVSIVGAESHATLMSAMPFGSGFTGQVRVASTDFTGDGVPDVVAGTGPGASTQVVLLDGATQKQLFAANPFESSFTGGVFVAAGDINGDGVPDIVVTPDQGGGPVVVVYDGAAAAKGQVKEMVRFFGIADPNFRGGARAAVGDVNGDGVGDLLVAAGFGGGPRVAVFDGKTVPSGNPSRLFNDFFAFEQTLRNGVFITAGDIEGNGKADIIAGGGPGGGPRVTAFSAADLLASGGATLTQTANFFAGDPNGRGGVRVAVKELDGDNKADLVTGSGTGDGSHVTEFLGKNIAASGTPPTFQAFDAFPGFTGGVFVG